MNQNIAFCKMHGLGNDFIVINAMEYPLHWEKKQIQQLADRHLGIGCDQLLLIESSKMADFGCRIFNADGSEAEQCGNGVRCIARFLHEEKLTDKTFITLETKAGIVDIQIKNFDAIQVAMGVPVVESTSEFTFVSMGNPHAIFQVPSIKDYPVSDVASKMTVHPDFPEGVNCGFVEVVNRQHVRLRTFERGSGETFACGSNACAAVAAGIQQGWLDKKVTVELTYGSLIIEWQGDLSPVMMTGPAVLVFRGIFPTKQDLVL